MPHYLVTARDGSDAEAPARRAGARAAHLARIAPLVASGALVFGGATLDETGRVTASVFVIEAADRAALDAWLAADPYARAGIWRSVEAVPFRTGVSGGAIRA